MLQDAALNWKTEENSLLYLQNLPFLRMMYTQTQQPEQMTVERLNANTKYTYVPYQAYLNDYYEMIGGDGSVAGQTAQDEQSRMVSGYRFPEGNDRVGKAG